MQVFGCKVLAHDPYVKPGVAEAAAVELLPLDDLIGRSHILSLHVPLSRNTHHLLNAERLAALPNQAIVINASRGGLIDELALAQALTNGKIAAAGLDVFEIEPLPRDSPLRHAPNLFMSPHAAFYSDASVRRLQQLAAEEAGRALRGEPLRCQIA